MPQRIVTDTATKRCGETAAARRVWPQSGPNDRHTGLVRGSLAWLRHLRRNHDAVVLFFRNAARRERSFF
jgi:hypothetical protein